MIPIKDDTPRSIFPFVTIFIIAINAAVYVYQLTLDYGAGELFIYRSAAIPYEVTHFADIFPADFVRPPFTVFTAMFVHDGMLHLGGNMLYLWIFGDNIEDRLGHAGFALFYLGAGFAASLAHIMVSPDSKVPMIGASGAVAGVLGAYFILYPRARVDTLVFLFVFVTVIKVRALYFLGFWLLMQIFSSAFGGGIAWFAHIGGFVAGALAIKLIPQRKRTGYKAMENR